MQQHGGPGMKQQTIQVCTCKGTGIVTGVNTTWEGVSKVRHTLDNREGADSNK